MNGHLDWDLRLKANIKGPFIKKNWNTLRIRLCILRMGFGIISTIRNDVGDGLKVDHQSYPGGKPGIFRDRIFTHLHKWLVVSTHLKKISQIRNLLQLGVKIKNMEETTT